MNKKILILSSLSLIAIISLFSSVYQYVKVLQVEAYTTVKPANGHSWAEMECTSKVCVTGSGLGMGTDSSAYKLDVQGGQINASGGLCIAGDCKTSWSAIGGAWATSGTNIYSANTGNVGIATTAPDAKLKIEDGGFAIGGASATSDTEGARRSIQISSDTSYGGTYNNHTGSLIYSTMPGGWGSSQLEIRHSTDWSAFATTPDMVIGSNVGIGTAAPTAKLEVVGKILVTGTNGDVCNAAGACLSQINSLLAERPLYSSAHLYGDCTALGGEVVSIGTTYPICRFSNNDGASCPSGWTYYSNWCTTRVANSTHGMYQTGDCGWPELCSTGSHAWANIAPETCTGAATTTCSGTSSAVATKTQVACY